MKVEIVTPAEWYKDCVGMVFDVCEVHRTFVDDETKYEFKTHNYEVLDFIKIYKNLFNEFPPENLIALAINTKHIKLIN